MTTFSRRDFLKTSIIGGVASSCFNPVYGISPFGIGEEIRTRVSLTTGNNRADLAFRALQPFSKQIKKAIGDRRVVLKPNNVLINVPLTSTHVDTLEGVLEFLKSINKLGNVIIAESAANGPTLEGFESLGPRMPVVLRPENERTWLWNFTEENEALDALEPDLNLEFEEHSA